jgi:hypothetical protein
MQKDTQTNGLVDAADRILRQLIRTPEFKETVVILLSSVDPPAARRLVRTLFWEDPALLMSVLGCLPALVNTALEALAEAAAQLGSMPVPLLRDILGRIACGLDGAAAGEAAGRLAAACMDLGAGGDGEGSVAGASSLRRDFAGAWREALGERDLASWMGGCMDRAAAAASEQGTAAHALVEAAARALREHPDFADKVLKPLLLPLVEGGPSGAAGGKGAGKQKKRAAESGPSGGDTAGQARVKEG